MTQGILLRQFVYSEGKDYGRREQEHDSTDEEAYDSRRYIAFHDGSNGSG